MTALTRRELVRAGAAGAILLGSGGLLGSDTARAALTQSLAPHAKRGGTLRVGIAGGSPTDDFDMAHINGPSATVRAQTFYETVPFLDGQFRLHDDFLADEFTPNATADVWTVRLKQGVEFHNGKTATAEDLLFSIKRLLDPKSGATAAGQLTAIDLKRTKDARQAHRSVRPQDAAVVLRLPAERHRLPRARGVRPEEACQHGPLAVQELPACAPDRADAVRELPRDTRVRRPARDDGAPGRHGTRERADLGSSGRDQPGAVSERAAQLKGQSGIRVAVSPTGGWNPDHHARGRRAVQGRSRAAGGSTCDEP